MVVRGAPAIGVTAAYAVRSAAVTDDAESLDELRAHVERAAVGLAAARPTAINLGWAIQRMRAVAEAPHADVAELRAALVAAAGELHHEEVERCVRIGDHGAELLRAGAQVLTHCNAGALATGGYGTALGVMCSAHRRDPHLHVWVDETRPLFQGARLTAWELKRSGVAVTLICDNMAALADGRKARSSGRRRRRPDRGQRRHGQQDRHLRRGAAGPGARHPVLRRRAHLEHVRPVDPDGSAIPIEHRAPHEVLGSHSAADVGVYNPAFDVTPADNISAIVTEDGVLRPPFQLAE